MKFVTPLKLNPNKITYFQIKSFVLNQIYTWATQHWRICEINNTEINKQTIAVTDTIGCISKHQHKYIQYVIFAALSLRTSIGLQLKRVAVCSDEQVAQLWQTDPRELNQ